VRVVSLVPSATETALALGLDVVACTRFCEQPGIETVGGTKNPDIERIAALAPDVVLVDEDENRAEDAVALRDRGVELFVSAVRDVAGAIRFTVALAERCALAVPDLAAEPSDIGEGRCVVVPIWRRPWMSINRDTYGSSVLAHLGFVNAFADAAERYPAIELADLGTLGPELVVVPSEPYEFSDAHLGELHVAVPDAAILRVDGRDLFWWGIRTPGALERLADALSVGSARPPA
jgi:ABC-type hemin transport system substrate-binding protein